MSLTLSSDLGVVKWIPRVSPSPNLHEHIELKVQGAICCPQFRGVKTSIIIRVIVSRGDIWKRQKKVVAQADTYKHFKSDYVHSKYFAKGTEHIFQTYGHTVRIKFNPIYPEVFTYIYRV